MGRRWATMPTLAGVVSLVVGSLFIAIPNWARAQAEYAGAMTAYVWSRAGDIGPGETLVWTLYAIGRTVLFTFAAGVVEHPILTVLFGVGFLIAGIWLIVEYGILWRKEEPWRGEFEM
jgi:hypothetical protein